MLTLQQAKTIAEDKLKSMPIIGDTGRLTIVDSATIEKTYAWIFFYNSKRYIETDDMMYALGGNAPLFISRFNGHVSTFSTGLSVDDMIDKYEEREKVWAIALKDDIYTDAEKLIDLKRILGLSNSDIADYKRSQRLVLDTGSVTRLTSLQKALSNKSIQTRLIERDLV